MAASAEIAALVERLEELEAERSILDTMYRYAHAIDYGLDDEWVDCYTDDAVYDVRFGEHTGEAARSFLCVGHDQLATFVAAHPRAPTSWNKHLLVEPRVEVDGDTATVASYFIRMDTKDGMPHARAMGRYLDHMVRGVDGRWRFRERIAEVEGATPAAIPPDLAGPSGPGSTR